MKYICVTCGSEVERTAKEVTHLTAVVTQLQLALRDVCERPIQKIHIHGVVLNVNYESIIVSIRNKLIDIMEELESANIPYCRYDFIDKYL